MASMGRLYDEGPEANVKAAFTSPSCTVGDNGPVRVLVIEDDAPLGRILVRGLVEDGYATDLAATVREAHEHVAVNDYDLVVLDLGLPDGDGIDLCTELRTGGHQVPVLVLTARDGLSDKVAGLDAGADDYLTKPFDFPELSARVRALLRRPAETRRPVLECGDLTLDVASHRVWRGAITIPLTAREFSLLRQLMGSPDAVVSRTELLEHCWDAHYDGLSNVVDVHVANLRRKLTEPGGDDPIETVRGVGYRLRATVAP